MIARPTAVLRSIGLILALVGLAAILPAGGGPSALAGPPEADLASMQEIPSAAGEETSPSARKLLTCGATGGHFFQIGSGTYQTLRTCSLTVPEAGHLFVSANGSVGYEDAYSRALFRIEINDTRKLETDRYIAVFSDAGDGSDASFAISGLFPVAAGKQTVDLVGIRDSGTGTMKVYDPTLTLLFIPGTGTDMLTCSDMDATMFTTTSSLYQTMRNCSLNLPSDGWVFISADATAWGAATPFEATFDIGIDNSTGTADATRWVNAYSVNQKAVDRSAALTMLRPISAGSHTFNFLAKLQSGASDIRIASPALSVIYMPAPSLHVASCSVLDNTPWTTTSPDFSVVRQCSMNLPEDSFAFVAADANLGMSVDPFEAHLSLSIDNSTNGFDDTDRYTNVYADSGDGTDDSAALSVLKPVTAGSHTFYFLGRRMLSSGTTLLRYPTLTVLVPVTPLDTPVLTSPADGASLCDGRPTFSWSGVDKATSHRIQVDDDPTFGSPEIDETVMGASYTVTPAQDFPDGKYHWRVQGLSPSQTGPWSTAWSFSVGPPEAPALQSPADGATIGDTTPEFRWSGVQGGTEYRLRVGRDPSFSSVVLDVNVAGTSHTPAVALASDAYSWRVQAHTPCGWGDWSTTWNMTIDDKQHHIYLPLLVRE